MVSDLWTGPVKQVGLSIPTENRNNFLQRGLASQAIATLGLNLHGCMVCSHWQDDWGIGEDIGNIAIPSLE